MSEARPPDERKPGTEGKTAGRRKPPGGNRPNLIRILLWVFFAVAMLIWWSTLTGTGATPISYSQFRQQLASDNVARVELRGDRVLGKLKKSVKIEIDKSSVEVQRFETYVPAFGNDQLLTQLESANVRIDTKPQSRFSWSVTMVSLLPFLLFIGLGYLFYRQMGTQTRGIFSMGRNRARLYERREEHTLFRDVAGARGAKVELQEIVDFLKDPSKVSRMGGAMPKGVLLVGPPGTGKTLLARAVAGEARVPFFNITGSDFMEMFVGVGASRVRELFKDARRAAPSIVFIDELDSIGRRRGAGLGGGHDEREQTLNQMLSEMDGFEPNEGVVVMAATNRPDILDPALLRPGRFDRHITVNLPTVSDRREILRIHARNKPLNDDVDLQKVARSTPGFSGADLQNLLNEAVLLAAREDKHEVGPSEIEEARDKVVMGLKNENLVLTEEERRLLAYHEAGHAVVAAVLPHADPLHKVTIVPRGRAMGMTQQLPERDRYVYQKDYLLDRLAVMMGGRAAEEQYLHTSTSGAESDLKQATRLARRMVLDWGMGERLNRLALGGENEEVFLGQELGHRRQYSDVTAREVDEEVEGIVGAAYERAARTLHEHEDGFDRLVEQLIDHEEVPGAEALRLIGVPAKSASAAA
jgi:cell division protease FtsH